ncbi:hypothetical protein AB6H32_10990 [Providencia hangzhouensis]
MNTELSKNIKNAVIAPRKKFDSKIKGCPKYISKKEVDLLTPSLIEDMN